MVLMEEGSNLGRLMWFETMMVHGEDGVIDDS